MPKRPDKKIFANLALYVKFLKSNFPKSKRLFVGNFYTFNYDFDRNVPHQRLKFYDYQPMIFFFDRVKGTNKRNLLQGINFHHLPINIRIKYMTLVKKLVTEDFDKNKRLVRLTEYNRLIKLFRKATKFAIRNYYVENMTNLRKIPNSEIENALLFYSKTYYGVNITDVEKKYLTFRV
jgi:hypothetical protein